MSPNRAYDSHRFLDAAMRAFWAKGYEGTSMADLVAATGVNRGSIYAAYDGKRDLFRAALARYDDRHRDRFLARLAADHPPRDAIMAAFVAAAEAPEGTPPGCLLVNTATEIGAADPDIAAFVTAALAEVERFFADRLRAGQAQGTIAPSRDPDTTATALLGLFLGLRVLTRAGAAATTRQSIVLRARALMA